MTREQLIEQLDSIVPKKPKSDWSKYQREVVNATIKALEQETVSKESYDHEYFLRKELEMKIAELEQQESVLDKIRAEILDCLSALDEIEKSGFCIYLPNEISGRRLTYQQCLKFIDKYKVESENA